MPDSDPDPLAPAAGVLHAVAIGVALWLALILVANWLW